MHKFIIDRSFQLILLDLADAALSSRIITTHDLVQVQIIPHDGLVLSSAHCLFAVCFLLTNYKKLCSNRRGARERRLRSSATKPQHVIRSIWKSHKEFYFQGIDVE